MTIGHPALRNASDDHLILKMIDCKYDLGRWRAVTLWPLRNHCSLNHCFINHPAHKKKTNIWVNLEHCEANYPWNQYEIDLAFSGCTEVHKVLLFSLLCVGALWTILFSWKAFKGAFHQYNLEVFVVYNLLHRMWAMQWVFC